MVLKDLLEKLINKDYTTDDVAVIGLCIYMENHVEKPGAMEVGVCHRIAMKVLVVQRLSYQSWDRQEKLPLWHWETG